MATGADRAWQVFLQRLAENDSSLAEIAESNEAVLLGILDDFGLSNLMKGQILTRWKIEAPKIAKAARTASANVALEKGPSQGTSPSAPLSVPAVTATNKAPRQPAPSLLRGIQPAAQPQPQLQRQMQPQPQPQPQAQFLPRLQHQNVQTRPPPQGNAQPLDRKPRPRYSNKDGTKPQDAGSKAATVGFACPHCKFSFGTERSLAQHLLEHSKESATQQTPHHNNRDIEGSSSGNNKAKTAPLPKGVTQHINVSHRFVSRKGSNTFLGIEKNLGVTCSIANKKPNEFTVAVAVSGANVKDVREAKKRIGILEFFDLLDIYLHDDASLILEYFANFDENSLGSLVGREGEASRAIMTSSGGMLEVNNIFKVKKVVVYGLPEEVERAKIAIDEHLTAYIAEKKETRFVPEKKERLPLTAEEYFFLICNHDEDLASFPNVRISGYSNPKNKPEMVIEGLEGDVNDATTEIQRWVEHFKDPANNFVRISEVYNAPANLKEILPRYKLAALRSRRESGCQAVIDEDMGLIGLCGFSFQIQRALVRFGAITREMEALVKASESDIQKMLDKHPELKVSA